ncbi:MAG: hypothetical protein J6Y08_03015 [Clostridiales bacterium]|nr:hypothetical protein [Clostridiales bacterium]
MDILFAEGSEKKTVTLPEQTLKDLAVEDLIRGIAMNQEERAILKEMWAKVPVDPKDIRFRQEIFHDLQVNTNLRDSLYESLSMIKTMKEYAGAKHAVSDKDNALYTLVSDLRSLSAYVNTSRYLCEKLSDAELRAPGLLQLRDELKTITGTKEFEEAGTDINKMLEDLSTVQGAIIGVNFEPDLTIKEISAIEFLPYPTRSRYKFAELATFITSLASAGQNAQGAGSRAAVQRMTDPLLVAIAPKLEKHLKRHFAEIQRLLSKYTRLDSHFITEMYEGLTFYLSAARYAERLTEKGYEICIPKIDESRSGFLEAKDFYNIRMALIGEKNVVKNDFTFSREERLFILTGPNRGGKTILEQGLGLLSLMTSLGLFVTASSCCGLPFKNILTHFPIDENLTINYGRLGEEAIRIRAIVQEADEDTLVLFNETYSTTSETDALYLSQDLLHILKDRGSAVIFNTHIHELARGIEAMDAWEGKSRVVSLVMEIKDNVNTFKLKRSAPDTSSYARNIAMKYGITYEQMKEASAPSETST